MMKFMNLNDQYRLIDESVRKRLSNVLEHGQFIMGPEIRELEDQLAEFVGVKHCIGVSSGTDALLIAMMALGIGEGDEVITTPFSFIATVETIILLGAKPVFVDIDPRTYNMEPGQIESAISDKTKAIIAVSLYGQTPDFEEINRIADTHGIDVIEDGAQSLGATYHGRQSCSLSTIGCTSFFPSKPLGCYGDGGACFTDNDDLAIAMKEIRVHGQSKRYYHTRIGVNGRLDTLQAAILLEKLTLFPDEVSRRQERAEIYNELLKAHVSIPYVESYNTSVFAQYTVSLKHRDRVQEKLTQAGIPTAIHYPIPLHKQPAIIRNISELPSLPVSEESAASVISLPFWPYMEPSDQKIIAETLVGILLDLEQ